MSGEPLVGRLAPSPTGLLHLGHARSFLLAWWSVRARGGRLLLRVEDLDAGRSRPEFVDALFRDLEWLGIDWDGPPTFQSRHGAHYEQAIEALVREGRVYACTCSRADVRAALGAPHAGGELRYPGTCRGRSPAEGDAEAGLRLWVPTGPVAFEDALHGPQAFDVQEEVGDFLVARRDGTPAYQLAVVVDDARQGVTEVVRGDDLLGSTARQLLLQRALQLPSPTWVHVPLVVDETGRRLAKRDADLGLAALRESGLSPARVLDWVASRSGMPAGLGETAAEWTAHFDPAAVPPGPVVLTAAERARLLG